MVTKNYEGYLFSVCLASLAREEKQGRISKEVFNKTTNSLLDRLSILKEDAIITEKEFLDEKKRLLTISAQVNGTKLPTDEDIMPRQSRKGTKHSGCLSDIVKMGIILTLFVGVGALKSCENPKKADEKTKVIKLETQSKITPASLSEKEHD